MTEMLTAKDMQSLLQVDRSTIYRMAETGRLPGIKIGKQWRFPSDQVEDWLNTRIPTQIVPTEPAMDRDSSPGHLSGLLPLDCVQLILDTFADSLGVMLVVTDMDGDPITEVSHPCGLFTTMHTVPNAVQQCVESWRLLGARIDLEPRFTPSHLGLLCARGLIRVGTELKGMVVVGGIAPDDWPPPPEQLQTIATEFDISSNMLKAHLDEVFYLNRTERAKILPFVQRIADIIAHIATERHIFMGKLNAIADLTR